MEDRLFEMPINIDKNSREFEGEKTMDIKHITFTEDVLKEEAFNAMKNCEAYLNIGNQQMAAIQTMKLKTYKILI